MEITSNIGVPWSLDKLRRFAFVQRYIGFDWDLTRRSVSVPPEKLSKIRTLLDDWATPASRFRVSDAESLHGRLVHISSIFPWIRPFTHSITRFVRSYKSPQASLRPTRSLASDLAWITHILDHASNSMPVTLPDAVDLGWWGDASTSFGVGVVVGQYWAVWTWSPGTRVGPKCEFDIGWAEAVAVELGLRLALHTGSLSAISHFSNRFLVRSDNSGVVHVVNSGRSRSDHTNTVLKEIYGLLAAHSLLLSATHVASRDNVSDALSRGDIPAFLAGFPAATTRIHLPLPSHLAGRLSPF